jgi:serine/threonine protein kinase
VIGTSIGNYQIQRLIGEGGMGQVYLAVHPGIGRQAAVKVLTPGDAGDPQLVSRFITEARAANAIRHPNIVDIYDSGVLEGGTPYLVMEYLEGETLTQVLGRGPVALDDAIDWGCQVAEALAAAHAAEVVHRDLKPDNLFLVADAHRLGKRQVKVLDFGIAKLQRRRVEEVHKTRTGVLLGTPLYMSPEQCTSQKDIDFRTDIYSLGVILYEMVTGRRPFDGEGVYEVITMHVNDPPVPPTTLRPDLPPMLEEIILKALAKVPGARQESMAVLHSHLELARGNATASSEALMRAQRMRPTPLARPASATPELRTLGDTAVPGRTAGRTLSRRTPARSWLLISAAATAVLAFVLWLAGNRHAAFSPPAERRTPAAPAVVAPPPPPAPAVPATIAIGLHSVPTGASVYVGDVLVGTTPTTYRASAGSQPLDLTFHLAGHAPEHIRALPAPGLTVTAKLTLLAPARPAATPKRKRARGTEANPAADIQTER